MADEQVPDKNDLEEEVPSAVEQPVEEPAAPAPEIKEELNKIKDYDEFWPNVDKLATVDITSPIDVPGSNLGDHEDFRGTISFDDFPSSGSSFTGQVKLIKGTNRGRDGKDIPNGTLILHPSGILRALANVAKEYAKRGESKNALSRSVQDKLPALFTKIFGAIKEKTSPTLNYSKGNREFKEKENVVHFIIDESIDKELGINLFTSFDNVKKDLEDIARGILITTKESGGSGKSPVLKERHAIRSFISELSEDKFKLVDHRMLASLRLDEIVSLGGEELAEIIRNTPAIGANGYHEAADPSDFWYRYYPKENVVVLENKKLTNRKVLEQVHQIFKRYGGGTPQDLFKAISDDRQVGMTSVVRWFTELINKLTPDLVGKVAPIMGIKPEEGIKKVAYPDSSWAGPSLEQVGGLVGDAQAKWASELAGTLAARFDYISFPTLAGGPSDLKKLATLPLTDEQSARVKKYREKAAQLLADLLAVYPTQEADPESGEMTGYARPDKEEVVMMAEDALLELVDSTPSTMPEDEFFKELKHKLHESIKNVRRNPHSAWPSRQTSPEDALSHEHMQMPEDVVMEKTALLKEEDAVQVVPDHPTVPPELYGKMGKIVDVKADFYMCPKHGPEPLIRYLVEFAPGKMGWFRTDEIRTVATTN